MVNSVNSNRTLSFAPAFDTSSSSDLHNAQPYPPCEKSILSTLNSSISHASESNIDWTDNHFISATFDAICTPGVTDWLQAETGLDYRPPVHQEDGCPVPLRSRFHGQAEKLTSPEREKLAGALRKLEKHCRTPEEKPEEAVLPEMESWKAEQEKMIEFRRLGKNREHLTVDIPRLQEKAVDLAEREWMPDTRHAGASLQLLCQEVSSHEPGTGDQKVKMNDAVHELCRLAEALEKADTLLAGVAEYRQNGDALALSVRPEAIRRDLQRAREGTQFPSLWYAVAKTKKEASWPEQESRHKLLEKTFEALEYGCRRAEQAIKDTRPVYLKELRAEQAWLREEAGAMMEACQSSSDPLIGQTAEALDQLCHLTANAMSDLDGYRDWVFIALRKSAGDLCDLSAALQNAEAIRTLVHKGRAGGKEVRALAEKGLNTVMNELKQALDKLKGHQKRLGNVPFSGMDKSEIPAALNTLEDRVRVLAEQMETARQGMKEPLPENPADFLLRALDHSRAARWLGEKDDQTSDVLSALGRMAGKGARSVQNGFAHYRRGAKRSEFNVLMRGAARGPLGMMLRVCRATEKLAFAALEASEKKPDVVRQNADRNRKINQDKPAQKVETYRKEKMAALKEAQKTAEGEIEKLALVHGRLNSDLDMMLQAFPAPENNKNISILRSRCSQSMEACQQATRQIRAAMDDLVNPGGKAGSEVPATVFRDKAAYERARRVITDGLGVMRIAMGKFEVEVALITGKRFDLFSNDARIIRSCAEVVDMCGAAMLPEKPTAEDKAESERVMRGMATEMGRRLAKPQDPEGSDFAERVLQEVGFRREDTAVQAQTAEEVMKFVHGWEQKLVGKASGKVVAGILSRAGRMVARHALPELFGGTIHIAKFAKAVYKASIILSTYYETRKNLENTLKPGEHLLAADKDTVRDTMIKSMTEMIFDTLVPSASDIKLVANTVITGVAIRRDGLSKVADQVLKDAKEEGAITLLLEGFMTGATRVVEDGVKLLSAALENTPSSPAALAELKKAGVPVLIKGAMAGGAPVVDARAQLLNAMLDNAPEKDLIPGHVSAVETEQPVKSRVKREAAAEIEQAPVNAASEAAEDDTPVDASQKTSVGSTDAAEFTMTEKEYNDTQIGMDVRNSTKVRTFIEKDIQDVIDSHPDEHGKITSPYSWVDTVNYKTKPPTFDRKRVIDVYTGNGVTDDVKILWEGGTGKRDSTDTSEAFRRELFGHKPYKINKETPFIITPLTPDDINHSQRSYTRLRQAWTNHMTGMRARMPEVATLYRNVFKLGFTNALNSPENNLSETEKTTIKGYLNGDTSGVITLRYNGQPVQDVIALVVPGTSESETHILIMDYDGNFKRVKATRELGEIKDGDTRYSFKPDEETQQFISRRLVVGDREKASAQRTQKVIMDPSSHYDTKLADRYLTTQDREFKRVVADPQKEMLDITYKAIDDMAGHLSMALGMAGLPESTPMGVLVGALITTGKGIVKYVITPADETTRLRNIRNQTIRDVLSGGFADTSTGKTMDNLPKGFNKRAKSGMVWYQKSTSMSGDASKLFNKGADKVYDWMGLAIEDTTRPDTLFSNAEQTSAPSEDALTSSSGAGADRSTTEALWTQTLADLNKGFDDLRYTKLSKETLERLEKLGIDYKKILDKHGSPASIKQATADGVTDYSQVVYDQHGVNELWGEASKAHKKWAQSERLERMIDKLEELESKVTGDQTIQIPYSLLKDFREAGFDIDYHLSGNAVDDDNNPQTRYAQKSEHARLNLTELKRLKFIATAKQLGPSDINGALELLDEIRSSLSGNEKTTIPDELQEILEKHGIKVKDYIRTHGDDGPARKAASQKGLPQLDRHLVLSDRTLDKHQFSDLAVMARLKLLEKNVQAPKDEVEALITSGTPGRLSAATINSLRNNGINIDAIADRYGTASSKEAAMSDAGELNVEEVDIDETGSRLLKIKIEQKIREYKISVMIERIKSLKKTPDVGYRLPHDITDFIKQGQATSDGELFLEHLRHKNLSDAQLKSLRWMLEAEVELSPDSTYVELAAFVRKMESETTPGERVTLPPAVIQYLRARGVSIDNYLQEKGNSEIAKENARIRGDENHLNKAEIDINKSHLKEIEDMIFAQKRRAETPDMMKKLDDLRKSIDENSEADLPEEIRQFVLASPEIDDNNLYLEELKGRTVTKAELDWLYWTLKAEAELGTDSTPEQTIAFMRKMESGMVGNEVRPLPPRLINLLKRHGIDVDDHLKRFGDTGLAKNLAVLRGNENILDSRDIKLSKPGLIKLREMLAAKPGARLREMLAADPTTQLRGIRARQPAAKSEETPAANPTTQPGEIPASKPVTQPKNDDTIPFMGMSGERRMW